MTIVCLLFAAAINTASELARATERYEPGGRNFDIIVRITQTQYMPRGVFYAEDETGAIELNTFPGDWRKMRPGGIANGEQVVSEEVREFMLKEPPVPELTERQRVILKSMTEGLINFAIAKRLGISEDGVKRHANVIFRKLGVGSRSEAIALAFRKHLLKA